MYVVNKFTTVNIKFPSNKNRTKKCRSRRMIGPDVRCLWRNILQILSIYAGQASCGTTNSIVSCRQQNSLCLIKLESVFSLPTAKVICTKMAFIHEKPKWDGTFDGEYTLFWSNDSKYKSLLFILRKSIGNNVSARFGISLTWWEAARCL